MVRSFREVHAQCVVSDEPSTIKIEFLNRNELCFTRPDKFAIVPREVEFSEAGIPTGVAVYLGGLHWNDGSPVTPAEAAELFADLQQAALPLRIKQFTRMD